MCLSVFIRLQSILPVCICTKKEGTLCCIFAFSWCTLSLNEVKVGDVWWNQKRKWAQCWPESLLINLDIACHEIKFKSKVEMQFLYVNHNMAEQFIRVGKKEKETSINTETVFVVTVPTLMFCITFHHISISKYVGSMKTVCFSLKKICFGGWNEGVVKQDLMRWWGTVWAR